MFWKPKRVPWDADVPIESTLAEIESLARSRAAAAGEAIDEGSRDSLSLDLAGVPHDLRALLTWHDRAVWSWFVNPMREMKSDRPGGIMTAQGEMITAGHSQDALWDALVVRPRGRPPEIVLLSETPGCSDDEGFEDYEEELGWTRDMLQARFVLLAETHYYGYYYAVALDSFLGPEGAVYYMLADFPGVYRVADSVSRWLRILLAFGGLDPICFDPDLFPSDLTKPWVREFRQMNPYQTLY